MKTATRGAKAAFIILTTFIQLCRAEMPNTSPALNLTAISASNGESVLECWALKSRPASFAAASNFYLGAMSNGTYSIIPPHTVVGMHNAPYAHAPSVAEELRSLSYTPRFSVVLSGLVHITVPGSTQGPSASEVWVQGGRNGLIIATDTLSLSRHGHFAEFPGDSATVIVQIPMANGVIPDHDILHAGPCGWEEVINL